MMVGATKEENFIVNCQPTGFGCAVDWTSDAEEETISSFSCSLSAYRAENSARV